MTIELADELPPRPPINTSVGRCWEAYRNFSLGSLSGEGARLCAEK
jgi:hypothetical protein